MEAVADPALRAYEPLARYYDVFTADYDHSAWLLEIERLAVAYGLHGRRLLDVGCGTGKSFLPLRERGYEISGCDLCPGMIAEAKHRAPADEDRLFVADMRSLPDIGPFDFVTCLDDAVNYLLEERDLLAAFAGVRRLLAPGGLYAFDANSLSTYRTVFASSFDVERESLIFHWRGESDPEMPPGGVCSSSLDVISSDGELLASTRHVQRHHPVETITDDLSEAGLECVAMWGQISGGKLVPHPDEDLHRKVVFFARRASNATDARGGDP